MADASTAHNLLLRCHLSPGDVCTLTAAVYSLQRAHPDRWQVDVETTCMDLWEHNPDITRMAPEQRDTALWIEMQYPTVHESDQVHTPFLAGYTRFLSSVLGVEIPLACAAPKIYLSEEEKGWIPQVREPVGGRHVPYWIVCAGVKSDFTLKRWPVEYYQQVIHATRHMWDWVQIGELGHNHPFLDGVIDLRGKTDARQLIRLVYHSLGGLGPVTFLQHVCAALAKPYICLLGGREPVTWTTYPLQQTLHTMGQLPCCRHKACWKSRVVPLGDGDEKDGNLCDRPSLAWQEPVGRCMAMIRPEVVLDLLNRYGES